MSWIDPNVAQPDFHVPSAFGWLEISEISPLSSCPSLDLAAQAFGEGRLGVAERSFEALSQDASTPSYARGLALFGLAVIALAVFLPPR